MIAAFIDSHHSSTVMPSLSSARYGKDNIRLYKVEKDEATKTHTVIEYTVTVLLEGDIDVS